MNQWSKYFISFACLFSTHLLAQASPTCCQTPCYGYAYNPLFYQQDSWCGLSGDIEYLYWKPDLRLNVATVNQSTGVNVNPNSELKRLKFDWDSGWRAGLTYQMPCDSWTLSLLWTHFQTLHHNTLNLSGTLNIANDHINTIVPLLFPVGLVNQGSISMKNEAHLQYNDLSLILSREFLVGPSLALTPFGGIKALFDTNKYQFELSQITNTGTNNLFDEYHYRNKFTGVGLTGGLKTYWDLFCNIGLEGFTSVSLLYGNSNVLLQTYDELPGVNESLSYRFQEVTYTLDAGFFLRWSQKVYCNWGLVSLRLGWEAHYISDQNRTFFPTAPFSDPILLIGDVKESPLTLHGLVIGLSLSL